MSRSHFPVLSLAALFALSTLLMVTVEDAAEADRTFDMLMGNAVDPRKRFIQTHARSVRNLDI